MSKFLGGKAFAESICALIIVFLIVGFCITLLYYGACGLTGIKPSSSDIANIFVASATLLGPIILVFTFNAWKVQHNKVLDHNLALKIWSALAKEYRVLYELNIKLLKFTQKEFGIYSLEELEALKANFDELIISGTELVSNMELVENLDILNKDYNPIYLEINIKNYRTLGSFNNLYNENSVDYIGILEKLHNELINLKFKYDDTKMMRDSSISKNIIPGSINTWAVDLDKKMKSMNKSAKEEELYKKYFMEVFYADKRYCEVVTFIKDNLKGIIYIEN